MAELTNGMYVEWGKLGKGVKTFLKISRIDAFALFKLSQFIARGVKAKHFKHDYSEKFAEFVKETKGEFTLFRVPFKEAITREEAIPEIKNYLDKANIKYFIQEAVNENDKALHICVNHKDEQKFNTMFEDYIKNNLSGGSISKEDLVNFTDGKTAIVSLPDAAVEDMTRAMTELSVNFAQLPDLMPDDGEKQFRIASVDLNATKQAFEAYKRTLIKNNPEEVGDVTPGKNVMPEMKVFSENDYMNTARETPQQWMDSASDKLKAELDKFNELSPTEQEEEIRRWSFEIKGADSFECQALRGNMAFSEISIDKETLVENNPIVHKLNKTFPNFFFCTVPGTKRQDTLMIPKSQVFEVKDADKARYVAFIDNNKRPHIYNKSGAPDISPKYVNGKELFKNFDRHDNVKQAAAKAAKSTTKVVGNIANKSSDLDMPIAPPVK